MFLTPVRHSTVCAVLAASFFAGCTSTTPVAPSLEPSSPPSADIVLTNGRVYTLTWSDPGLDGQPAPDAPRGPDGWHPDAEAVALKDGMIVAVGSAAAVAKYIGPTTRTVDLAGATVLPGLIDSHTHIMEFGHVQGMVNLEGVDSEDEAIARIAARAQTVPQGEWVLAWGFDEGAWAGRYPDHRKLSAAVPDHPVHAISLHGFATWSNRAALEKAGITKDTPSPVGGRILKDRSGQPTGILLNNASDLFDPIIPPPTPEDWQSNALRGLEHMAKLGFVAVHEAGVSSHHLTALESLDAAGRMPIRLYAMLSARDEPLMRAWIQRGPRTENPGMLSVRAVKAYYDGSLGARGARMLDDYSDRPGHRGVSGDGYGFNQALVAEAMGVGFQVGIHAIGDAGNRETLDFFENVYARFPAARGNRHRVEHAQLVHPDDQPRFARLGVIASMEPPHAVEDMAWAEERVGKARAAYGYAWRTLRKKGARVVFNSDMAGSDPDIFYGLHAAMTRRNKKREPPGGWFPEEVFTPEEAVRAYTVWNAYAAFMEDETGTIATGRWADLTVMDVDPLRLGETDPGAILEGKILMTIAAGRVVHSALQSPPRAER